MRDGGARSKEVEENPRLGWDTLFSRNCKKRRREKNSSLYRQWLWVPQLKSPIELNIVLRASDGFDEEGRIDRRNFYFPKSISFTSFVDIENSVQILCKKTVLPLSMAK